MTERRALSLTGAASAIASVFALALSSGSSPLVSLTALGIVSSITGLLVFVIDGGPRSTPAGVFFLSVAVFLGGAMTFLGRLGARSDSSTVLLVGAVSHAAMIATVALYARRIRRIDQRSEIDGIWKPGVSRRDTLIWSATILVGISLVLTRRNAFSGLGGLLGYSGLALATATIIITSPVNGLRTNIAPRTLPALFIGLYAWQRFSGSGRLIVTGLVLMMVYALGLSRPRQIHKTIVVVALFPALIWASAVDVRGFAGSLDLSVTALSDGTGLGSMYGPLDSLAEMQERESDPAREAVPRQYGATFFSTAVVWIPRELWSEKPLGWGAVLAETLSPQYRAEGHSDMALVVGEFYGNFGPAGLLVLPPVLALFLAWLRKVQVELLRCSTLSQRDVLRLAALLAAIASVPELFWGGTFAWASRGGMAAGFLIVLSFAFNPLAGQPRRPSADRRNTRSPESGSARIG